MSPHGLDYGNLPSQMTQDINFTHSHLRLELLLIAFRILLPVALPHPWKYVEAFACQMLFYI